MKKSQHGFTLIEIMVTITIIGITALLLATGVPQIRTAQQLLLAQQQFKSLLRQAQQQTMNLQRSPVCLDQAGSDVEQQRNCSHVGVALRGNEYYLFADFNEDYIYTGSGDVALEHGTIGNGVTTAGAGWQSFVFILTPPTTSLWASGRAVTPDQAAAITFRAGASERKLKVLASGVVERL